MFFRRIIYFVCLPIFTALNSIQLLFLSFQADGEEPIVSDSEEDGNSVKKAQIAAEQAAAKIMPPPPTPPVSLHKGPVISSAINKMHQIAPKVRQ